MLNLFSLILLNGMSSHHSCFKLENLQILDHLDTLLSRHIF